MACLLYQDNLPLLHLSKTAPWLFEITAIKSMVNLVWAHLGAAYQNYALVRLSFSKR